jgi:hypothetical protein
MNVNQLVNMVIRMVLRRGLNRGINAGIGRMAGKGKRPDQMTPEERRQAQATKQQTIRAKQALRVGRKFGKF